MPTSLCDERIDELKAALMDILRANDEFRAKLPDDWEGDPVNDACERAKRIVG